MNETEIKEVLLRAEARAQAQALPYRGLLSPAEAYALLQQGHATLIDVRTRFEAEYVGRVENTSLIEWKTLGASSPNPGFLAELAKLGEKHTPFMFLCRSGVRSHAAAKAAAEAGYQSAFNILEGFEGDLDGEQHRGTTGGWRFHGLPWIQG